MISFYTFFNVFSCVVLLIYNLLHYKEKKLLIGGVSLSAIKHFEEKNNKRIFARIGFWTVLEIILISTFQYFLVVCYNKGFGNLVNTGANYFGTLFFAPLVLLAVCKLLKINILQQMDLITPGYPLGLVFVKIACYFGGCCRGIAWEDGFYNPISRQIEFPIQLLESAVALLLFLLLLLCKKKIITGTMFPIYLIAYSVLRFCTEFLRVEPEVFIGLKTYQLLCIAGVIIGAIEYYVVSKYYTSIKVKE